MYVDKMEGDTPGALTSMRMNNEGYSEGKQQDENREMLINYTDTVRRSSRMPTYHPPKRLQTAGDIILGGAYVLSPLGRKQQSFPPNVIPKTVETASHVNNPKKRFEGLGSALLEHNDFVLKLLVCPITKEVFQEPCILVSDGWTYEKGALVAWFQFGFDISPATGENLYGVTAFADCKITSKLLSILKLPSPSQPLGLKRLARERYQELTSYKKGL